MQKEKKKRKKKTKLKIKAKLGKKKIWKPQTEIYFYTFLHTYALKPVANTLHQPLE